jgi:hypothetical protein
VDLERAKLEHLTAELENVAGKIRTLLGVDKREADGG